MPRLITYVEVGICSGYQDGDYAINGKVADLSRESFQELRLAMIYAIYAMEEMWRKEQDKKNVGQQVSALDTTNSPLAPPMNVKEPNEKE